MTEPPQLRYFMCRLVPPRPTFAFDMNEQEKAVMQAHAAYMAEHVRTGTVVVCGPVADPAGPYGLGVLRVRDEDELKAFLAKDPAGSSTVGLHWEWLPMLQAMACG
jgi:uncharacterized protein YciI